MLRRWLAVSFALFAALACAAAPAAIDRGLWESEVGWLADPAREGRGLGSAGLTASALRLAERFAAAGLEPAARDGTYLQRFRMPVGIRVEAAALAVDGEPLVPERDFRALFVSDDGEFAGPLAFAADGARDEASGRDDWAQLPEGVGAALVLEERERPLGHGALAARRSAVLRAASERGVRAVLFAPASGEPAALDPMDALPTRASAGVMALALSRAAAERIAMRAGLDLETLARASAHGFRPSLARVHVAGSVRIARRDGEVANVVGRLPGADAERTHEQLVLGAHYDHIGRGEFGSLQAGAAPAIHPGADDNASGAAGLVALAEALATGPRPARTLVFVAFTAEEAGLVGSARYLEAHANARDVVAMLDLDMIGRLGERGLTVFGAETGSGLTDLVRSLAARRALPVAFAQSSEGPSDQETFRAAKIPALLLSTGTHAEYHTPADRPETLAADGAVRVLALTADLALALANAPSPPAWEGQ